MNEKNIILTARVVSMVFTPFYLPLLGMLMLFTFSYLSICDWLTKLFVYIMVYLFTVLLPTLLIHSYQDGSGPCTRLRGRR